jgi:serine/arginine repetitive matrix protein 2
LDDDDEVINHNINPRMSTLNPMMGMGLQMPMQMGFGSPNSVAWGGNIPSPYLMPPADPNFLAAHQHAMLYAKQAYQMAVAQQAMAAAGDEWERSSSIGGYGGSSVINASSSPAMISPQFGMMPMGQGYGWSSPSSVYLPSSSRSVYSGLVNGGGGASISNSRSELGVGGPKNWPSSRSSYGESFGPSLDQLGRKNAQGTSGHAQRDSVSSLRAPVMPAAQPQNGRGSPVRSSNGQRDSTYLPPVSPMPASQFQNGRGSPDGTPRLRTGSQPASPSRSTFVRKAPPPSSWKAAN